MRGHLDDLDGVEGAVSVRVASLLLELGEEVPEFPGADVTGVARGVGLAESGDCAGG